MPSYRKRNQKKNEKIMIIKKKHMYMKKKEQESLKDAIYIRKSKKYR